MPKAIEQYRQDLGLDLPDDILSEAIGSTPNNKLADLPSKSSSPMLADLKTKIGVDLPDDMIAEAMGAESPSTSGTPTKWRDVMKLALNSAIPTVPSKVERLSQAALAGSARSAAAPFMGLPALAKIPPFLAAQDISNVLPEVAKRIEPRGPQTDLEKIISGNGTLNVKRITDELLTTRNADGSRSVITDQSIIDKAETTKEIPWADITQRAIAESLAHFIRDSIPTNPVQAAQFGLISEGIGALQKAIPILGRSLSDLILKKKVIVPNEFVPQVLDDMTETWLDTYTQGGSKSEATKAALDRFEAQAEVARSSAEVRRNTGAPAAAPADSRAIGPERTVPATEFKIPGKVQRTASVAIDTLKKGFDPENYLKKGEPLKVVAATEDFTVMDGSFFKTPEAYQGFQSDLPVLANAIVGKSFPVPPGEAQTALQAALNVRNQVLQSGGSQEEAQLAAMESFLKVVDPGEIVPRGTPGNQAPSATTPEKRPEQAPQAAIQAAAMDLEMEPFQLTYDQFKRAFADDIQGMPEEDIRTDYRQVITSAVRAGKDVPESIIEGLRGLDVPAAKGASDLTPLAGAPAAPISTGIPGKAKKVRLDARGIPILKPNSVVLNLNLGDGRSVNLTHKQALAFAKQDMQKALDEWESTKASEIVRKIGKVRWTKDLADLGDFKLIPWWLRKQIFTKEATAPELTEVADRLGLTEAELIKEIVDYPKTKKKAPSRKLADYYANAIREWQYYLENPEADYAREKGASYGRALGRQRAAEGMQAAVKDPKTGELIMGASHSDIIRDAIKSDADMADRITQEVLNGTENVGFVDQDFEFMTRREAERRFGVLNSEYLREGRAKYGDQTQSPEFKKWFGDSKVVDVNGKPLVVYHGTGTTIDEFKFDFTNQGNDQIGSGFYFTTSKAEASAYTTARKEADVPKLGGEGKPSVISAYLSIKNPLSEDYIRALKKEEVREFINRSPIKKQALENFAEDRVEAMKEALYAYSRPDSETTLLQALFPLANDFYPEPSHTGIFNQAVKDILGYDGVVSKPLGEGSKRHYVAFFPEQIKSATGNRGTFNPKDPNILRESGSSYGQPTFYSAVEKTITEKMPAKASPDQVMGLLRNTPGIKQEELEWLGLDDFLKDKKSVTKEELQYFVKQNNVQIKEVMKGDKSTDLVRRFTRELEDRGYKVVSAPGIAGEEGFELYKGDQLIQDEDMPPADRKISEFLQKALSKEGTSETKFHNYTLPGGENYRELLLTLPERVKGRSSALEGVEAQLEAIRDRYTNLEPDQIEERQDLDIEYRRLEAERHHLESVGGPGREDFVSGHFAEPNILAHVRFNERTDAQGNRVLFIEEIQSDWHQKGREKGYARSISENIPLDHIQERPDGKFRVWIESERGFTDKIVDSREDATRWLEEKLKEQAGYEGARVPDAPFKKTWHELALKRVLRHAVDNGYDSIAWTTGMQQAERYDLSKQVNAIDYKENPDGTYRISAQTPEGRGQMIHGKATVAELPDIVGKEVAGRIVEKKGEPINFSGNNEKPDVWNRLSGVDLKVGGEGMKGFYDQMIPSFLNKYTKKWGGRVGSTELHIVPMKYGVTESPAGDQFAVRDLETHEPIDVFDTEKGAREYADKLNREKSGAIKVHALEITPDMKDSILQGQSLFERGTTYQASEPLSVVDADNGIPISKVRSAREFKRNEVDIAFKRTPPEPGSPDFFRDAPGPKEIYQSAFAVKYQKTGTLFIPNQKVYSPQDIAFAFRYLHNEAVENFLVGAVKNGRIVGIEHIATGLIDQVSVNFFDALHLLDHVEADGYFIVHNHPSGYVDPSQEDLHLTRRAIEIMDRSGFKLMGHVIIDDTKFGFIDPELKVHQWEHKDYAKTKETPLLRKYLEWSQAKTDSPMTLTSPQSVFEVVKGIQKGNEDGVMFMLNTQNRVINAVIIPQSQMNAGDIQRIAARYRGNRIILANSSVPVADLKRLSNDLAGAGIQLLDDVVASPTGYRSAIEKGFLRESPTEYSDELTLSEEAGTYTAKEKLDDEYAKIRNYKEPPLKDTTKEFLQEKKGSFREFGEKMGVVISDRLASIDPSLKIGLRRFENDYRHAIKRDLERVKPFMQGLDKIAKANETDALIMDIAMKNGDMAMQSEMAHKYGIEKELEQARALLEEIRPRIKAVGYQVGYRPGYFPRKVRNRKGYLAYMEKQKMGGEIEEAIRQKEESLKRDLTEEEKVNLINSFIRGFTRSKIALAHTGNMKTREIEKLTVDLNKFYYSGRESLARYIAEVNEAIEARKFFGRVEAKPGTSSDPDTRMLFDEMTDKEKTESALSFNNIQDSIGAFVNRLLEAGKINPEQQRELRDLFQARFGYIGSHGLLGLYKNVTYMNTITSVISGLSNLDDLGVAVYKAAWQSPGSILRAVANRSNIKLDDLGLEAMNEEIRESSKSGLLLKKLLRFVFTPFDRIGKETTMNAVIDRYRAIARGGETTFSERFNNLFGEKGERFEDRLVDIFGAEADNVLEDLKEGRVTENILFLAFNELSEIQPISLAEVPQLYLESPGGRLFYTLKTFMVKRLNFLHSEMLRSKNKKEAITQMLKLYFWMIAAGVGVDELKDFILGRKTTWSDRLIDNLLRPIGISKYLLYRIREDGAQALLGYLLLPPTPLIDGIWKDVNTILNNETVQTGPNRKEPKMLEMTRSIPLFGKEYYWWLGRGAQKMRVQEYKRRQKEQKGL